MHSFGPGLLQLWEILLECGSERGDTLDKGRRGSRALPDEGDCPVGMLQRLPAVLWPGDQKNV